MLGEVEIKNKQQKKIKAFGDPIPEATIAHSSGAVLQAVLYLHESSFPQ